MLKAYTQPWFILYGAVVLMCLFTSIWFGLVSILIASVPIILVDSGRWPKSTGWINMSKKFKLRHRIFVGGMYVVLGISYVLIGPESLSFTIVILSFIFHWVEILIRIK